MKPTSSPWKARFVRTAATVVGADFGLLLAWAMVDTPSPPPLLPRISGYLLFVVLCAWFGWLMTETAR